MKNILRHIFAMLFLFLGWSAVSHAQNGGAAGSFSRIGFGPRGMAMGNALTSVTTEGIYSYYNPALAAHCPDGNQIDLATAAMSFDRSFNSASGSFHLPPTAGITLSVINANVTDIDGRSTDGYYTGTLETHEYQIAAAIGLQLSPRLSVGLGLKYFIADYHTDLSSAKTLGLDIGLLYELSDRLRIGGAVQDLLAAYNWDSGSLYGDDSSGRTDSFPKRIRLGISYLITPDLILSLEGGRLMAKGTSSDNLHIGTAYHLHERITVRAGWQVDELTSFKQSSHGSTGFSIHLPFDLLSPSVDYAFKQESNRISYMHTFGLRLNL